MFIINMSLFSAVSQQETLVGVVILDFINYDLEPSEQPKASLAR